MPQIENAVFYKRKSRMLGFGLDSWNNIIIIALAVAAVAAIVVGISTFAVIRLQKAEALEAEARIAEAKVEAARANESAAILGREAAESRLEIEKIRGRELSTDQLRSIHASLSQFGEKHRINIAISVSEDAEAVNYGTMIYRAIVASGYSQNREPFVRMEGSPRVHDPQKTGVLIADEPREEAEALQQAFAKAGVITSLAHIDKGKVGTAELLIEVWRKP